jgi:cyclopropane fatty-acyl-phospholipid synthase-like methyltransferase
MIRRFFFELQYLFRRTPWDTGISPPELLAFLESHPPGRALDLGCGTGTNVLTMALKGWKVTGVDFSSRAIRKALQRASDLDLRVDLKKGDVTKLLGVEGPFDLVLDIGCFHSLTREGMTEYASNLSHLLRPAGTYLLYAWIREPQDVTSKSLTLNEIRAFFDGAFEIVDIQLGTDRYRKSAWFTLRRKS